MVPRLKQHYDEHVRKAREDGIVEGRNEAIKNVTARRGMRGDGVPALAGSRKPATELSAEARKSQARRRSFAEDGHFDGSWPGD